MNWAKCENARQILMFLIMKLLFEIVIFSVNSQKYDSFLRILIDICYSMSNYAIKFFVFISYKFSQYFLQYEQIDHLYTNR